MESFLSTLLGAFLGVSLPFVISAIIERINFKKMLNTVFVQYETHSQHCRVMASRIVGEATASWSKFQKKSRKTLTMNFESIVDCSDLLLAQYSKFLRPSDSFAIIQDRQNTAIVLRTLLDAEYESANDLNATLATFNEFLLRRTWTLLNIAKRRDLSFSSAKYNLLIEQIGKMKNKRLTKVQMKKELLE
jgi:hypothetical protein